jgi:Fumarylacetoacetate (FAA) hydrolase family
VRTANLAGRLVLVTPDGTRALDIQRASAGRFSADPQAVYDQWPEFAAWAAGTDLSAAEPFAAEDLGAPAPAPRQVLAIGLNYAEHAAESGFDVPDEPTVMFTKWQSCLTGPVTQVELPDGGHTDWEVELVAVIGRRAFRISEGDAWDYVAGLTAGQDISERILQSAGPSPQFSLAKSPRPHLLRPRAAGRAVAAAAAAARRHPVHRHPLRRRARPQTPRVARPGRRAGQLHLRHRRTAAAVRRRAPLLTSACFLCELRPRFEPRHRRRHTKGPAPWPCTALPRS